MFFGRTPGSGPNEIRPASAVNVFGRIEGDAKVFKTVTSGAKVRIEQA
ncbi:MAG: cyclophilin-like family protein [Anaerolineae bacterium]